MSRGSEVHIFWGAPVGPLKMTRSQEPTSLMSTANPWEKIQLLYNQHSFSLKDEDCEDENLEEYQVLEAPGPPDLLSGHVLANTVSRSVHGKDGVAHCISETQTVKSQKRHPLGMRDVTQSHVQTCGCACRVQRLPEEEKYQKLSNENKKVTVEPHEDQSNICDQNAQNSSFQLDLVWSTEQIPTAPDTVEPKCVPTGPCKAQNLRLEKTSSNTGHKPESEGAVRKVSDLKVSADTEFLSVMTSSQFAFLVQMKSKGEKSVSKGTGNIEIEPEACHGEIKTTEDNLIQPDDAFVERYESRRNQAYSLELFSPVFSETKSSCIHITSDEGLKENRGSQGLCRSEAKLLSTEVCVESHGSGILCSQLSAIKRSRTSEDKLDRLQVRQVSKKTKLASNAGDLPAARDPRSVSGFKGIKKTSLIKNCDSKSQKYNCLVMVLSPCHVKEIRIKSGPNSGSQVPLATVVVTDQSEMKKKVFLWRTAAFWALTVSLGDIILLTDVTVRDAAWDGEVILQSTFTSQLLNLGSHASVRPEEHSGIVSDIVLRDLLAYVSSKHSYLRDLPQRQPQKMNNIEFVELEKLQPDILVHAVLRVIDITVLTEALYSYRGQQQKKIMLTVEQDQGQHSVLILWGRAAAWYPQLQRKKGYIWEFKYLFVQRNCILENLELHTTPWSSCECLFDDDIRAITFKAKFQKSKLSFMKMSDLATHLEDKCSGVVLIKAWVSELAFPVPAAQKVVMNAHSSLRSIFSSLPSVTYTGCAQCGSELETDENKIYRPCVRCLPSTRKAAYYRPALMTIVDGLYKVSVHVGSKLMEKVLLNISPAWLNRVVAPPSAVTYGLVAADALHSLLAGGACLAKVQSRFVLDENSYPLQQQFSLLDLSPPVDSGELASCALP